MRYELDFCTRPNGRKPVQEFLDELTKTPPDELKKAFRYKKDYEETHE